MTQHNLTYAGVATALVGVALVALASCSGSTDTSTTTPHKARTDGASASPTTAAQQAIAVYKAMWADVQVASQTLSIPATGSAAPSPTTPSYQNPILQQHLDGQALLTIEENLDTDESQGIIGLGAPVLHPTATDSSATTVQVRDCMDDTHWLEYYAATHTLVNDIPGGHRYTTATVTDENGTWKVTQLDTRDDGSC